MRFGLPAKRCDLYQFVSGKANMGQPKTASNQKTVAKQFFYLIRGGIGPDIKIFRLSSQKKISDTAADQICLVAVPVEPVENLETIGVNLFAGYRMVATRDYCWLVVFH
jgi:hypothetical protein